MSDASDKPARKGSAHAADKSAVPGARKSAAPDAKKPAAPAAQKPAATAERTPDAVVTDEDAVAAILRMLGLARRARRLAVGTEATLGAIRKDGASATVAVASDASERTKKQIGDKCASHGAHLISLGATRAQLAAALGSKDGQTSACAVTDRHMAKKIDDLINT